MPINSFDHYPMSWRPQWDRQKPLYVSLARCLEEDIAAGRLLLGTKLPPQRELADFLDVNVSTVSRAFRICSDKGVLTSVTGSGTFVAYDVLTNLSVEPSGGHVIEMGSMMPERLLPRDAAELLTEMMAEEKVPSLFQYGSGRERWHMDAAATALGQIGVVADSPSSIVAASGGQNAIAALLAALCRPGDRIGVDPLVYPGVKQAAKLFGVRLVPIAQEGSEMSAAGIAYAVQNHGIKGLYVMPDFQNPTGTVMSGPGRAAVARAAAAAGLFIIEDGITRPLVSYKLPTIQSLAPERTYFILSLSKAVLPALRLAYILCPPGQTAAVGAALAAMNLSQSELLLELASRLIATGRWQRIVALRRAGVVRRNALAEKIMAGYSLQGSRESLCRWLSLPPPLTGRAVEKEALARGLSLYGCDRFAVGHDAREQGVRLVVSAPASDEELAEGLRRLRGLLESS